MFKIVAVVATVTFFGLLFQLSDSQGADRFMGDEPAAFDEYGHPIGSDEDEARESVESDVQDNPSIDLDIEIGN